MPVFSDVTILLLAAGKSVRFGPDDKLLADFQGSKLIQHAARACAKLADVRKIAIMANPALEPILGGVFETYRPSSPASGMGDNIARGARLAIAGKARKMLVVLGDMPFVSGEMLKDLADLCKNDLPSACYDGKRNVPPACFPESMFGQLSQITGDGGARSLLQNLPEKQLLHVPPGSLRDIDSASDLASV